MRLLAIPAIALTVSAWGHAPNPAGSWTGHVKVDTKGMNPQMIASAQKAAAAVISLTLKADHTFALSATGQAKVQTGKWAVSGSTVTITASVGHAQKFMLSANGKSLSLVAAPQLMSKISLILSKK